MVTVASVGEWIRRYRGAVGRGAALLLLGVLAGAFGFAIQPVVSGEVGPGTVVVDPSVRPGDTVVGVPPLGQILAQTHEGPLAFTARLDRIHVDEASAVVRGADPGAVLRGQIESDLRPLLRRIAGQSVLAAAGAGLVASLLIPRRRVRASVITMIGALGFVAVSGVVAFATFDPEAFDEPRFEGELARAPDVVDSVQRHIGGVGAVESRLEALADRIEGLYRSVEGDGGPPAPRTTFLHVSDIHSNPVGIQLVEETAEGFDVDAIIDTGDLTSFGVEIEAAVVTRIARIDTPYYVIPGNHDHDSIRADLEAAGVEVLDPGVVVIGGVRILGVGEPTFTADNEVSATVHEANIAASARRIERLVDEHRPDVVAVHNARQLVDALGSFDIGMAGHVHEPSLEYVDGTAIVEAGSAGATGVGALFADDDLPYQMQLLHFEERRLVAVDRLEFQGTDGAFQLQRLLIDPTRIDAYPDRVVGVGPDLERTDGPR